MSRLEKKTIFLFFCGFLILNMIGCEAFVRKFTRKAKKEQREEMVLVPQEYQKPKLPLKTRNTGIISSTGSPGRMSC